MLLQIPSPILLYHKNERERREKERRKLPKVLLPLRHGDIILSQILLVYPYSIEVKTRLRSGSHIPVVPSKAYYCSSIFPPSSFSNTDPEATCYRRNPLLWSSKACFGQSRSLQRVFEVGQSLCSRIYRYRQISRESKFPQQYWIIQTVLGYSRVGW